MRKAIILLSVIVFAFGGAVGSSGLIVKQQPGSEKPSTSPGPIKVTITTGGGLFGRVKDRYQVGQQVPVTITMTNISTQPVYVCDSDTQYQDLPKLVSGGRTLPYLTWQSFLLNDSNKDNTCRQQELPAPIILRPNESRVVDWFVLVDSTISTGALAWYDSLPTGKYELSIQRRFGCCDGPMVESNKINFEIIPRTPGRKGAVGV
jgi:hypothetical protein